MQGRNLSLLTVHVPCLEPLGVVKSALHGAPIAEAGDPFRLRIRFPYVLARTEPGRGRFFKRKPHAIYAATANFLAATILCTIL